MKGMARVKDVTQQRQNRTTKGTVFHVFLKLSYEWYDFKTLHTFRKHFVTVLQSWSGLFQTTTAVLSTHTDFLLFIKKHNTPPKLHRRVTNDLSGLCGEEKVSKEQVTQRIQDLKWNISWICFAWKGKSPVSHKVAAESSPVKGSNTLRILRLHSYNQC